MARVVACGVMIIEGDQPNTYVLHTWERHADRPAHPLVEDYHDLTWTELVDVLLAVTDRGRPGWEYHPLGHQPPLWAED